MMIVDFLLGSNKNEREGRKAARERLLDIVSLIPDGPTQKDVLEKMWENGMFKELKSIIRKLSDMRSDQVGADSSSNRLGTTAVLIWAMGIEEIGMEAEFVDLMRSDWAPKHQLAKDPQWREAIDNANDFVVAYLKRKRAEYEEYKEEKMGETIEL